MSGTVIFDTTNNADTAPQSLRGSTNTGDSFTTSNVTSVISDMKLVLLDQVVGDTGSVVVTLWSDNGNAGDPEPTGASPLATLGTIADSALGTSDTTIDLVPSTAPSMTASTRYWIELTDTNPDVLNTGAVWAADNFPGSSDVGATNEYYVTQNANSAPDSSGPMLMQVTTTPACFAEGTRILTDMGEVAVETLQPGTMLAVVREGGFAPMRWLGHRRVDCARHPRPHDVWPVRVAPGAFGAGRPRRELVLSPDHAVFVTGTDLGAAGALVPVRYLLNGATIRQTPVDAVTYYHVELDRHDILLADGLAAESYLDTGNRAAFANGGASMMAHPDFARRVWSSQACAPLLVDGPALAELRARLHHEASDAGFSVSIDPDLHVVADGARIDGTRRGGAYVFECPPDAREVWLASRSGAPAETSEDSTDFRRLGVAVADVTVDGVALGPQAGHGWYDTEGEWQWTDGMAALHCAAACRIEVTVAFAGRYWQRDAAAHAPLARAA